MTIHQILIAINIFLLMSVSAEAKEFEVLKIEDLKAIVIENNLELKAEADQFKMLESESQSLGIPAPMLGFIKMTSSQDESATGFEVSQAIPSLPRLKFEKSARALNAQQQSKNLEFKKLQVLTRIKSTFYVAWLSQEKLELLQEKRKILVDHLRLTRTTARSDSFANVHLLKTETDLDLLGGEILAMEAQLKISLSELALLIDEESIETRKIQEPRLSKLPDSRIDFHAPAIESSALELKKQTELTRAARSQWFPDFNLKYRETNSGTNIKNQEVMIGMSLPFLFFWEPSAQVGRARAAQNLAEHQLEFKKRELQQKITQLSNLASAKLAQLQNLRENILPKALKRQKIVHNLAPRDLETLQDHRETMEALPEIKMKILDLRYEFEVIVFELQTIKGRSE